MVKKSRTPDSFIVNRRARFDYELLETIRAGIVLTGAEVRAVRDRRVSLQGAYATIRNGELWLINATFSLATVVAGQRTTVVDTESRKLLVKKQELRRLIAAKEQGMTIVPLGISTTSRYIKVELAIAKGKKLYDKRETIKRRDLERDYARHAPV